MRIYFCFSVFLCDVNKTGEDKEARNEQRKGRIITNTLSVPHDYVKGYGSLKYMVWFNSNV